MKAFSSLTNRIFFTTAGLTVVAMVVAIYIVNRAVSRQADAELQRGINEAATLVDEYRKFTFENFGRDARLIADLPVLKAALSTGDRATVEPIAREYQSQLTNANLFAIADNRAKVLVRLGLSGSTESRVDLSRQYDGRCRLREGYRDNLSAQVLILHEVESQVAGQP